MAEKGEDFPRNDAGALVAPEAVRIEGERLRENAAEINAQRELERALREAKPSFLKDGMGIRGPFGEGARQSTNDVRHTDFPLGSIDRGARQPPFPEVDPEASPITTAKSVPDVAFFLSNASVGDTKKVKVRDGKIKGTFPAGMGFDNYVLTLTNPDDSLIYAGITFNAQTLEITSRFLGVSDSATFPVSRIDEPVGTEPSVGFVYWLIGFTYTKDDVFKILNTRVGDINFELVYGANNAGKPALLPVDSGPGWIVLRDL